MYSHLNVLEKHNQRMNQLNEKLFTILHALVSCERLDLGPQECYPGGLIGEIRSSNSTTDQMLGICEHYVGSIAEALEISLDAPAKTSASIPTKANY